MEPQIENSIKVRWNILRNNTKLTNFPSNISRYEVLIIVMCTVSVQTLTMLLLPGPQAFAIINSKPLRPFLFSIASNRSLLINDTNIWFSCSVTIIICFTYCVISITNLSAYKPHTTHLLSYEIRNLVSFSKLMDLKSTKQHVNSIIHIAIHIQTVWKRLNSIYVYVAHLPEHIRLMKGLHGNLCMMQEAIYIT